MLPLNQREDHFRNKQTCKFIFVWDIGICTKVLYFQHVFSITIRCASRYAQRKNKIEVMKDSLICIRLNIFQYLYSVIFRTNTRWSFCGTSARRTTWGLAARGTPPPPATSGGGDTEEDRRAAKIAMATVTGRRNIIYRLSLSYPLSLYSGRPSLPPRKI